MYCKGNCRETGCLGWLYRVEIAGYIRHGKGKAAIVAAFEVWWW